MTTALLVLHLLVTLALIGVVLIQRSEGGGLGIGSSQGMGSFMSGRGTANLLTRTTAILATAFLVLSLVLALLNRGTAGVGRDILDTPPTRQAAPSGLPVPPTPGAAPGTPVGGAPVAPPVRAPVGAAPAGTVAPGTATPTTSPAATPGTTAPAAPATTAPGAATPGTPAAGAPSAPAGPSVPTR